jgi:hypothetical protein
MVLKIVSPYISVAAVILIIVSLRGSATAQEAGTLKAGTLNGTIVDPQGAAVPNAEIALRWNDAGGQMSWNGVNSHKQKRPRKKWLQLVADSAGRFSTKLAPGDWDVFAYRDIFAPTCTIVLIEPGKTTVIDLRFSRLAAMSTQ